MGNRVMKPDDCRARTRFAGPGFGRCRPQWIPGARAHAFSVLELLVTLVVLVTVVALAVPGFLQLRASVALGASTHALVASFQEARGAAIRRQAFVSMCTSSDGASCTDSDWHEGWIVFVNPQREAQPANPEAILRVESAFPGVVRASGNQPVARHLGWHPLGTTQRPSGALLMGTVTLCVQTQGRKVVLNRSGRARQETTTCSATVAAAVQP